MKSKKTSLTPFQIHSLMGLSAPDKDGMVNYKEFAVKAKDMINELFTVKTMSEKATLIQTGSFKPADNLEEINISSLELFKVSLSFLTLSLALQEIRFELERILGYPGVHPVLEGDGRQPHRGRDHHPGP